MQPEPVEDAGAVELEVAVNDAIEACNGDLRAAVRALVVANNFLTEHNDVLIKELDYAWRWISPGFTRSANRRRIKTGESD